MQGGRLAVSRPGCHRSGNANRSHSLLIQGCWVGVCVASSGDSRHRGCDSKSSCLGQNPTVCGLMSTHTTQLLAAGAPHCLCFVQCKSFAPLPASITPWQLILSANIHLRTHPSGYRARSADVRCLTLLRSVPRLYQSRRPLGLQSLS